MSEYKSCPRCGSDRYVVLSRKATKVGSAIGGVAGSVSGYTGSSTGAVIGGTIGSIVQESELA